MKPLLSVIILSFNTKKLLRNCLKSVFSSDNFNERNLEVIVVDNASTDGSAELVAKGFTKAKLIQNSENLGFSAGNNKGIREAKGKYILLLNSDTRLRPDTLCSMIRVIERDKKAGAATCKLILGNGKIDPACHRGIPTPWNTFSYMVGLEKLFPRSRLFGGYHQGWKNYSIFHEVDVISGAFFLIPRKVIEIVGLLDESFFMYGEDIDWCYRIKKAGYRVLFDPRTSAIHYKKQSGRKQDRDRELRKRIHRSFMDTMAQFYMKHYADKYPRPVTWLVRTGIKIKKYL